MNRINVVTYGTGSPDSFTYYLDGELNTATLGNLGHTLTYNMDKMGNRTSVVDNNVTSTYAPNWINQYNTAGGISVSNGPEHEIQSYNGVTYTYMNDERLQAVSDGTSTYSLTYDALGRCVKRSLTGAPDTYYIYDGEKPILEYNSAGGRSGYNLYGKGIDEILKRGANGSDNTWHWYYFNQNHEGSVTVLTDASGNVLERYRYDAFGAPTIYTATWGARSNTAYDNRFLFTGREYAATYRGIYNTAAFNFYEYRARAYNPKLGRFMSEDPKLFDAGDYNLFRYCHNDPVDFTDPMGLGEAPVGLFAPRAMSRWKADEEYGQAMAQAQWANSGAIAAGMAGYNAWFALSKSQGGLTMAPTYRTTQLQPGKPGELIRTSPQVEEQAKIGANSIEDITNDHTSRSLVIQYDPKTKTYSLGQKMTTAIPTLSGAQVEPRPPTPDRDSFRIGGNIHSHFGKPHSSNDFTYANTLGVKSFIVDLSRSQLWRYTPRNNAEPTGQMQGRVDLLSY